MRLDFYCTRWGFAAEPIGAFCARARTAGYHGIEVTLPPDRDEALGTADAIRAAGLGFIALRWSEPLADATAEIDQFERHLRILTEARPEFVNCHTGRDWYDRARNQTFLDRAAAVARETGVPIHHETHRGRFSFSAASTCDFLRNNPELTLTADFSHWCCVSESLLEDQQHLIDAAIERVAHVHCRVGHGQAAQVNDPRAPEWHDALAAHMHWWAQVADRHRKMGAPRLTLTPEFGPAPYMPETPHTREPLADQWQVNLFMKDHVAASLGTPRASR